MSVGVEGLGDLGCPWKQCMATKCAWWPGRQTILEPGMGRPGSGRMGAQLVQEALPGETGVSKVV